MTPITSYTGYVEEIRDTELVVRVTSSTGEEAEAVLPIEGVPESERQFIALLAKIEIRVYRDHSDIWFPQALPSEEDILALRDWYLSGCPVHSKRFDTSRQLNTLGRMLDAWNRKKIVYAGTTRTDTD